MLTGRLTSLGYAIILALATVNLRGVEGVNCASEGRFSDPDDCTSFIDCFPNREGGFSARYGSCKGHAFHPLLRKCIPKMKGCEPKRTSRFNGANENLNYFCKDKPNDFVCFNCKTVINCINGTAYPEDCSSGDYCYNSQSHGGGVCYPDKPKECHCKNQNEFQIDKYDKNSFFYCETMETDPLIYKCPKDMEFDVISRQCRNQDGLPPCKTTGVFANPNDCRELYTCILTNEGWIHKKSRCSNDTNSKLIFNEEKGQCEDACIQRKAKFSCTQEGRFPDPRNCRNFYECIFDETEENSFIHRLKQCPIGYEWDPLARNGLGFCIKQESSVCKSVSYSTKCKMTKDFCRHPEKPETTDEEDDEDGATFIPVQVLPATLNPLDYP